MPPTDTLMPPPKKPKPPKKPATAPASPSPAVPVRPAKSATGTRIKPTNLTLGDATLEDLEAIRAFLAANPLVPGGRGPTVTDAVRYAARQVADRIRAGENK